MAPAWLQARDADDLDGINSHQTIICRGIRDLLQEPRRLGPGLAHFPGAIQLAHAALKDSVAQTHGPTS
eukprot:11209503-Lingulodinium_polyedra.AAC.1